jgi:hypothetical protein
MSPRVTLALLLWAGLAHADAAVPYRATACVAALTEARAWAARLDSSLEKLQVRADGKRVIVSGSECGRVEVEVRADAAAGRVDRPWRAEKRGLRQALEDEALCGERHVELRAHGGFVASVGSRAVPPAIVERFKRAVDECVSGAKTTPAHRIAPTKR